jgi:uncharacterized protein
MESFENQLFPVFLKLENYRVLIVGGGPVGLEKTRTLLSNAPDTKITLVSKGFVPEFDELFAAYPNLKKAEKNFSAGDLEGIDLLILALNDAAVSEEIKLLASQRGILTNAADKPELCDFYLGSIVKKGALKIAISTNGKSPVMAKRIREVLEDSIPDETEEVLENLAGIRKELTGHFRERVKKLNALTEVLVRKKERSRKIKAFRALGYSIGILALMILGHLIFTFVPFGEAFEVIRQNTDPYFGIYILGGFAAQMIDGAFGMAYGVSVTTFLLSLGFPAITPAVASASMHASEVFTTGASSLVYMRYKNINKKLFRSLLLPGVIGAVLGAFAISFVSKEQVSFIRPVVATYTLTLGILIIVRAIRVSRKKAKKFKRFGPIAGVGGFLDSVGGGGWGPIVTTSLIAGGRNLRYAIGSSHMAKFFVALASTLAFFIFLGLSHWQIISGLVIGGMIAAPISIYFSNRIPVKTGLIIVGLLVSGLSIRILILSFLK